MELYDKLKTYRFFQLFREISDIPRESGNEQAVSNFVVQFAKRHGLEVLQDQAYNVVVKKKAAQGHEGSAPVMLQAHLDMVCEKRPDSPHNFLTDPISFVERDGWLMADDTTLGADDAFGVAYMLAILEDPQLAHPAIEAVFTTDEEVGMGGMEALDVTKIAARRLVNLDSEEEGELCASCAGGVRYDLKVPVALVAPPAGSTPHRLSVEGLCGGHSGMDIGRERGNSVLLLSRLLNSVHCGMALRLSALAGGAKTNAIPREAYATIWLQESEVAKASELLQSAIDTIKAEYAATEPQLSITLSAIEMHSAAILDETSVKQVIAALRLLPNGVFSYNPLLPGILDSSSNLGIAELHTDHLFLSGLIRSNTNSKITDCADKLQAFADIIGASLQTGSGYPAWEFQADSPLRALCGAIFSSMYGKEQLVASTHGGLECGLLAERIPHMDMVSIGPNIRDAHTPQERIEIGSFIRVWEYLVELLQHM